MPPVWVCSVLYIWPVVGTIVYWGANDFTEAARDLAVTQQPLVTMGYRTAGMGI
jgi:hypothetical protein